MPPRQFVDVALVEQLLAQGLTQTQVHLRTGAAKSAVSRIANGKYPPTARKDLSQKIPANKEAANV